MINQPTEKYSFDKSFIFLIKKLFYCEVIFKIGKQSTIYTYFFLKNCKPRVFILRKIFLIFLCLKIVLLDPFPANISFAQTNILNTELQTLNSKLETNFNLVKLTSPPVSFNTSLLPTTISISSSPISFKLSNLASAIKLSSNPVSLKTSLLPSTLTLSSKPVSYSLSKTADLIKLSSLPVSYLLNSFVGELIKLSSAQVSYKTFNGIPILDKVSPNVLPISQNGSTLDVSLGGENFVADAVATIGTLKIQTKYLSSNELTATIPANYLEKENSFELFIANPPPEGGVSKGFNVMVVDPIPIAKINAAPNIGVAPQIVTFDGTETEDLLAKYFGQKLSYSWNFGDTEDVSAYGSNGVSAIDKNTSTNAITTHKYEKSGKYNVTLNVVNAYGKTSSTTKEIEIRDKNEAPIVDAAFTTSESDDYLEITFDASMSLDPEGDPISFTWDTGDDASENTNKTFTYRYTKKGTFIPKITVTDSLRYSTVKFLDPITYLGPNIPPVVIANISPSEGYLKHESTNNTLRFVSTLSAKDSFDKDGNIAKYEWHISGNDLDEVREGEEITYEFNKAGTYNIKLSVTDNRNKTQEKIETITILKPDPVASVQADKTSGESPLSVQFRSDGSRDYDNSLVNITWNFGDDSPDSTELNPIHTYNKPGAYLPTLTVIASDGRTKKISTKSILVNENTGPHAKISLLESQELGISNEAMIKLSANGSFDPENNQILTYNWSWIAHQLDKDKNLVDISQAINEQLKENTNEEFPFTFTIPGQYTSALEVKTEDGRTGKINGETITILPGQEPVAIAKITSEKLNGIDLLTVMFDASGSFDPKTNGQIVSYLWEFSDGQSSNDISPEHIYNTPGTYNAKLTVQDNRGFKSSALTQTIKVISSEEQQLARINEIYENPLVKEKILKLQILEENQDEAISFAKDEEKPIDSTPPQISLSIDNPELKAGESLSFNAHITDDTSIETIGYKLIDENNNPVLDVIEPASGNIHIDFYMAQIDYTKNIVIPENILPGKYKLLLFAKDKTSNWLGKTDSSQIVSSEINIIGKTTEGGITTIEALELNEKSSAAVIKELDELIANQPDEEASKLIEIVAADNEGETANLAREYLKQKTFLAKARKATLKERIAIKSPDIGKPSAFGVPSTISYANTVQPIISVVMTSESGTPYIDLSFKGTVSSNNVKGFSGVNVMLISTTSNPAEPSKPIIQSHFTTTCATGRDCSAFTERLNEINEPRITYVPVDKSGSPIGNEESLLLDPNDLSSDKQEENNIPEITSLNINETKEGTGALKLIVTGSMFNQRSIVLWDNITLNTTYKENTKLTALVPAHYTKDPKKVKIKIKKKSKDKELFSEEKIFEVKPKVKKYFDFDTKVDSEQEIKGDDPTIIRSGGNVYISDETTVFKEAGDVTIPFNISENSSLNIEVVGALINSNSEPTLNFYHNNRLVYNLTKFLRQRTLDEITSNKKWNINLVNLNSGFHTVKLSLPDIHGQTIFILDRIKFSFTSNARPQITDIKPSSIYPDDLTDRELTISGKEFGEKPKVKFKGYYLDTKVEGGKIKVTLPPDLELLSGEDSTNLQVLNTETNKLSDECVLGIRSPINIAQIESKYNFNPHGTPGPSASLDVTITSDTKYGLPNKGVVFVFDKDGMPITDGSIKPLFDKPSTFNISFALANDLSSGKYHILTYLERENPFGNKSDYSSKETKQLIEDLIQNKTSGEGEFNNRLLLIPASHKRTFEVGLNAVPTIRLYGAYESNGVYSLQENQELKAVVKIQGNIKENITVKTNLGDGTELTGDSFKHIYKLTGGVKNNVFEIKAKALKDGVVIGESKTHLVYVYKDLPPVGIAKIDTENYKYQGDAPFKTGFTDKSFDPNDEISNFSGALDKTLPEKNIWKLFKYKGTLSNQTINTEDLSVIGNQVLSSGKSFLTGNILNPGTYYAKLIVFDEGGNSDTTQSETVQVTVPYQMLLVHASFYDPTIRGFEYDTEDKVKVQFKSKIQTRGNKQPKNIIYKWDFSDGTISDEINPIHIYKRSSTNRDRINYHPDLTVTAIWEDGVSESWSSKAGTVSILDKPEFVALEIVPDVAIGNTPLTVNFMIGENSIAKNSTLVSYSFDYGDGSEIATGFVSSLDELKQKIFTHTYTTKGEFNPILSVKVKENSTEYKFNSPIISTNGLLVSSIEVLDPPDSFITNQPIFTFKIRSQFANPFSAENRLTIHVVDEDGNETITELDPSSSEQTIALSEGENKYWFELIDPVGGVQKSIERKVVLDTIDPALEVFSPQDEEVIKNNSIKVFGIAIDKNLEKVEYQIDNDPSVAILEGDTEKIEEGNIVFLKEIKSILNGKHKLKVRATDKGGNISEEVYDIGVGEGIFIFNKVLFQRTDTNNQIPIISNNIGTEEYSIGIGSPFKLKTNVLFFGDESGIKDPYANISLSSLASYRGSEPVSLNRELFEINKELLQSYFTFNFGDLDGKALTQNTVFQSSSLNQRTFTYGLNDLVNIKNVASAWDLGLHNIKINANVTSPSGGVSLVNLNDPNNISGEQTDNYNIRIIRPEANVMSFLEPTSALLEENTNFTAEIKVKDALGFNLLDKKLNLLTNEANLIKPEGSMATIDNLTIIPASEQIDPNDTRKASVKVSFNLKPDILPSKEEEYKLIIPIKLASDRDNLGGLRTEAKIDIPVVGIFPAIIESPQEGELVTENNLITARLKGAAKNINNFEKKNVKFAISINGNEPIKIKSNLENKQTIRVNSNNINGEDITFDANLRFDLHKQKDFTDSFLSSEAFGKVNVYSTYTNISDDISFKGNPRSFILLDNPIITSSTKLKKDKKGNIELKLVVKNNTTLDAGEEILVKLTPFNAQDEIIPGLDEAITTQKFTFSNSKGNPKLTEARKISLPPETTKVKIEINRSDGFLNKVNDRFPDNWKSTFIDKVKQEETKNRTFIISLDGLVKGDCESIGNLLTSKLTDKVDINSLKKIANCEVDEIFFSEDSKETDSIKLPFVEGGIANIPADSAFGIDAFSLPFNDQLTLAEFKQLLKDLGLLKQDNNNGYDIETKEATYQLLYIIDQFRCLYSKSTNNLRQQVLPGTFMCSAIDFNVQGFILDSIQKNLPTIIWLKVAIEELKQIGQSAPALTNGLPDTLLMRAIVYAPAIPTLAPWLRNLIWLLGLFIHYLSTIHEPMVQAADTTCTNVVGFIDRRFIIGKDLNNQDIYRKNTMAGISIEGKNIQTKVVDPLIELNYPGFYSTCLPSSTHNIQLQFNGQNTFSMSVTVPDYPFFIPYFVEPFVGGVFRKYGKDTTITKIVESKTILNSLEGDIQTEINPTGSGAYLTSLSLVPNLDASKEEIAKALRLYTPGTFEVGNQHSTGELEPDKAQSFIDLATNTRTIKLKTNILFPLQFVIPNSELHFHYPSEVEDAILIDRFN